VRLRKKTIKAKLPTVPVSVCLKRSIRESLIKLTAVRKLKDPAGTMPSSVVGIVDQAIFDFEEYLKTADDVAFLPVPASDYMRVSLRVNERPSTIAQRSAAKHDVRITDFYRTAVTRYIRKHEKEITSHRAAGRPKASQ
jgi:hypothetical protein